MKRFFSHGKLLITGEYLVLDGAKALALPTKKGQSFIVKGLEEPKLIWESLDEANRPWLRVEFELPRLRILSETFDSEIENGSDSLAIRLQEILTETKKLSSNFLADERGWYVQTKLDFPRNWGLGSSSTLINNIAQWAKVDAYNLQFKTFGGSAYDIACAQSNSPLVYQLKNTKPSSTSIAFDPDFKDQLYFIHLNKKQNSREGIATYRKFTSDKSAFIDDISALTEAAIRAKHLSDFEQLLKEHELIIASIINQNPIQKVVFQDYFGQIKSLGAWGGDFILATGNDQTPNYFKDKGYPIIIPYQEMVL